MTREHSGGWSEDSVTRHEAVLLHEVIEQLDLRPGQVCADLTVGGGGHLCAAAAAVAPGGTVLGLDRDALALGRARARLAALDLPGVELRLVHAAFGELERVAGEANISGIDRILMDLGFSSDQLDDARRGFSFLRDGPLDMRMDPRQELTAADVVNGYPEADLAGVIYDYGEERNARRIAAAIAEARRREPLERTLQLAAVIAAALPGPGRGRVHPATRTFQALRIEVNDELGQLRDGLAAAVKLLNPSGRLAVISFHSLEDREIKDVLRGFSRHGERTDWYIRRIGEVVRASREEISQNPRSRSARLRVFEKVMAG